MSHLFDRKIIRKRLGSTKKLSFFNRDRQRQKDKERDRKTERERERDKEKVDENRQV